MRILLGLTALALMLTGATASCSEKTPAPLTPAPQDDGGADVEPTLETPSSACVDPIDAIYGDPGPLAPDPAARGAIVRCAQEPNLTKDALAATLTELGWSGAPLTSGARVYKISYRTERGDAAGTPAVSSAIVYVPDTPRADKLPIVVAARGSRGQAERCAVTKFDPALAGINGDAWRLVYPLVGYGYAVILPDLAGYASFGAPGNPPSAYAHADDVARSTLDASRALSALFPVLDDKVILVGHSQGGHSALSALAFAETYGSAAPIAGVALYAPLWLSQRSWGAVLYKLAGKDFPLADSSVGAVSVWYHYTKAELVDGPGAGRALFAPDKQDAIEAFVKSECWGSLKLAESATYAHELFDPTFVSEVATSAATGAACSTETCQRWIHRYLADRPHLTGAAATTPILVTYGLKDTTIPQSRMQCAIDRLKADNASFTACVDAEQTHGGIVSARGEYVANWIASVALGEPAPAACADDERAITEPCALLPPND